jgi:hypothetical protein
MAIEAGLSKFKQNNLKIYIVVLLICGIWFGYDGHFSEKFRKEHTDADGKPDSTLVFNQKSPPFFIGAAVLLAVYLFAIRNKKIIADENELIISDKKRIAYDSIEKIDKTYFRSKTKRKFVGDQSGNVQETRSAPEGYFIITYKDNSGREVKRKLSSRTYDNLAAVLDELVAKIS